MSRRGRGRRGAGSGVRGSGVRGRSFHPSDLDGALSLHDADAAPESNGDPLAAYPETIGGLTATAPTSSNQATTVVQGSQPVKYGDFDGLDDHYQCATASDWRHLHEGDATILATIAIAEGLTGTKTICATTVNGTGAVLFWMDTGRLQLFLFGGGDKLIDGVTSDAGLLADGEGFATVGVTYGPDGDIDFFKNGEVFSSHSVTAYTAPTGDPTGPLSLLARTNGSAPLDASLADLHTETQRITAEDATKYHAWSLG